MIPASRLVASSWTVLAWTSALYFLSGNEADNDLWIHTLLGRDILSRGAIPRADYLSFTLPPGQPWFNHEWLSQVLFASAFDLGGGTGLWLFKLTIGFSTAVALWRTVCTDGASTWASGTVVTTAMAILSRGFAIRPQILTYCAVAWLLWFLRARAGTPHLDADRRAPLLFRAVGIGMAFCLWANSHGGFVFGLVVLLLHAAVPPRPLRTDAWLLVAAAVVGCCLNPYGPGIFGYIVQELSFPHPITEWQPIEWTDPAQRPLFFLLGIWAITLPWVENWRRDGWQTLLVAGCAFMAFRSQRYTPLLGLVAAPAAIAQLDAAFRWIQSRRHLHLSPEALGTIAALLYVLAGAQLLLATRRAAADGFRVTYLAEEYPVGAIRYIRQHSLAGKLALPLDWGAYALWHLSPAVRVSIDARFATIYTPEIVHDNAEIFYGTSSEAARVLRKYLPDMILAPSGSIPPVRAFPHWKIGYRDDLSQLYVRNLDLPLVIRHADRGPLPFP